MQKRIKTEPKLIFFEPIITITLVVLVTLIVILIVIVIFIKLWMVPLLPGSLLPDTCKSTRAEYKTKEMTIVCKALTQRYPGIAFSPRIRNSTETKVLMEIWLEIDKSPEIEIVNQKINEIALTACQALNQPDSIIEVNVDRKSTDLLESFGFKQRQTGYSNRSAGATCSNWSSGKVQYGGPLKAGYPEWNDPSFK